MRRRFFNSIEINNIIYYTTSDNNVIVPTVVDFGANLVKNEVINGVGIMTFDSVVMRIGNRTFANCISLTSITIPDSVTSIGSNAFYNCSSLKDVYYTGDISAWCKISFEDSVANPLYYGAKLYIDNKEVTEVTIPSDITEIKNCTFRGCTSLASITIPDSVTTIGMYAFSGCSGLTAVTIGNSVTSIGSYAFRDCTSLASITIPDNVTEIGMYAFSDCSSLTSITIPDSVTTIGNYAFLRCRNLASVYCKSTTPPILGGEGVFNDNAINRRIYVSYQSLDNYKTANFWSDYADDIVGYDFETDNIDKYTITMGVSGSTKAFDYLYNKYGICGSTYSPIEIDEEVYLENFPDYTKLNGKVTRLYVINETGMWLYNEDSMTVYYAATLTKHNNGELTAGTVFYD